MNTVGRKGGGWKRIISVVSQAASLGMNELKKMKGERRVRRERRRGEREGEDEELGRDGKEGWRKRSMGDE